MLDRAVRSHLAADVPVGAFVSGGWDSSLTAALAARASGARLKTFSVIFPEDPRMDESRFSGQVARHLGTDHHEIEFRAAAVAGDSAQADPEPGRAVHDGAGGRVFSTVVAGGERGQGGNQRGRPDELFGGYEWVRLESPDMLRRVAPRWPFRVVGRLCRHPRLRRRLRVLGAEEDRMADAEWRRSLTPDAKLSLLKPEFANGGPDMGPVMVSDDVLASCSDSLQRRLAIDFTARLADGILFMADKVSMAHSLEVRMPFLDREVVDFALALPSRMKVLRGREKRVLSGIVPRHLPRAIAERRKHGLGYPKDLWASAPVAQFVRQLLLDPRGESPFLRPGLEKRLRGMAASGRQVFGSEQPRASAKLVERVYCLTFGSRRLLGSC